jgi:hypothetical protein
MSRKYFLALRGEIIYIPAKKMIINRRQCTTIILDENVKVTTKIPPDSSRRCRDKREKGMSEHTPGVSDGEVRK